MIFDGFLLAQDQERNSRKEVEDIIFLCAGNKVLSPTGHTTVDGRRFLLRPLCSLRRSR